MFNPLNSKVDHSAWEHLLLLPGGLYGPLVLCLREGVEPRANTTASVEYKAVPIGSSIAFISFSILCMYFLLIFFSLL